MLMDIISALVLGGTSAFFIASAIVFWMFPHAFKIMRRHGIAWHRIISLAMLWALSALYFTGVFNV